MRKWSCKASQLVIYKIQRPSHRAPCMQNHAEIKNRHSNMIGSRLASSSLVKENVTNILVKVYMMITFKKTYLVKNLSFAAAGLVQSSSKIFKTMI